MSVGVMKDLAFVTLVTYQKQVVYYESKKRKLQMKRIYECRCNKN
jgi:hypothetical protein